VRWSRIVPVILLACLMQITLVPLVRLGDVWPNLTLLVLVFVALNASSYESLAAGLLTGLVLDFGSGLPLGLLALCYGGLGVIIAVVRHNVFIEHPLSFVSVAFGAALLGNLAVAALDMASDRAFGWRPLSWALLSALYSAAVSPLVVLPLGRVRRWFGLLRRVQFSDVR
jgi:rod shape-determining protein MreD